MTEIVELERPLPSVAVLALNDPQRRNILSPELVEALADRMGQAEADPEVRAVVVTGRGKAFCAGADLSTLEASASGEFERVRGVYEGFLRILHSPLPTIAAVDGPAVGAGMNLALACDVRLASPRARFDTRFVQLGLHPGGGHTWLLQRAVGYQRAVAAVLYGEAWDATTALRDGLVASIAEDVLAEAGELAGRLASHEGAFVRRVMSTLRLASASPDHQSVFEAETEAQAWSVGLPSFVDRVQRLRASISSR
jgi:enoyl-CoA hydratase